MVIIVHCHRMLHIGSFLPRMIVCYQYTFTQFPDLSMIKLISRNTPKHIDRRGGLFRGKSPRNRKAQYGHDENLTRAV